MTDRSKKEPLSSDELIRQAKEGLHGEVSDSAIQDIVDDLENIDVDVPVEDSFPEPIPDYETRSGRRPQRQQEPRRVISAYDAVEDDPFDRDDRPTNARAVIVAITALLLLAIGGVIAFVAAATGM